ncbi:MAG: DNA repair protein RadA [Deltaproteobacteria bacterium]|jgi:DNA repair protein RadA/Sms|nr:DNA repair protein RadA [Deltaproteobacteria bacterium]
MAKPKIRYLCRECGWQSPVSLGRCPSCQAWDSFDAEEEAPAARSLSSRSPSKSGTKAVPLKEVPHGETLRLPSGISELDRVLGGGQVPGGVILLSGEPGVGKSTLLLQVARGAAEQGKRPLYVTGEESAAQLRLRAERLGLELEGIFVLAETEIPRIMEAASGRSGPAGATGASGRWDLLIVDSAQTMRLPELGSGAGSPAQIRESSSILTQFAKETGAPLWLVGHITKDGSIAGPKLLEHLVDTVLYFEGERDRPVRILRSFKNRFGPVNEVGVFEMTGKGLCEILNPSALFLAERLAGAAGSAVTPVLEGRRPLMMEIQALVSPSPLPMPRRQTLGADPARVSLLTAVLEKKVKLKLFDRDVFVNVAGGARISEPAADLAIAAAVVSSWFESPLKADLAVLGEVGLAGEVRRVGRMSERLAECARMGFKKVCGPAAELDGAEKRHGLKAVGVSRVSEIFGPEAGLFENPEGSPPPPKPKPA